MAEGLRLGSGLAWFRWRRRRRSLRVETAPPISNRQTLLPDESAATWTVNHAELGEMAAVAIEMLDLIGRRRRRGG